MLDTNEIKTFKFW